MKRRDIPLVPLWNERDRRERWHTLRAEMDANAADPVQPATWFDTPSLFVGIALGLIGGAIAWGLAA